MLFRSARVGSITDNRLGGWHAYRMGKAALNMLVKNLALELARTHPQALAVTLHPGTVDTALSEPFQRGLAVNNLPACLIGMEACSGAHHWAREFAKFGHTVRLMAPKFVAP